MVRAEDILAEEVGQVYRGGADGNIRVGALGRDLHPVDEFILPFLVFAHLDEIGYKVAELAEPKYILVELIFHPFVPAILAEFSQGVEQMCKFSVEDVFRDVGLVNTLSESLHPTSRHMEELFF